MTALHAPGSKLPARSRAAAVLRRALGHVHCHILRCAHYPPGFARVSVEGVELRGCDDLCAIRHTAVVARILVASKAAIAGLHA